MIAGFLLAFFSCRTPGSEVTGPQGPEGPPGPEAPAAAELEKVSLATAKNVWNTLAIVALEKGFFRDEGLDVQPEYLAAGRYCLDALVSGSADVAMIVEVNSAYYGYTGDTNIAVVATIARSYDTAVVARKGSGISSPADLRGKKLAISPGTTSELYAARLLEKHGMTFEDLQVEKIQPPAMFAATTSGAVDAASTWEPFVHNIEAHLAAEVVTFRDPEVYLGYMNMAVRKDWAAQHKDTISSFLGGLKKAADYSAQHPAEAQKLVASVIRLEEPVVASVWTYFDLKLGLDKERLLSDIRTEAEWVRTTQDPLKGREMPDFTGHIDDSYIAPR